MNNVTEEQSNSYKEPTKIWNATFISIFIASAAVNLGQMMSNQILAKYADSINAPASAIGLLMSSFAITALLAKVIAGPAIDTYNRKYILAGATVVLATSFFGFSLSHSVNMLMAFRLLQGVGLTFGNVCCLIMAADSLPKEKYGVGIGYFSLAQVMCQAIGPTIGLSLVSAVGYRWTYTICSSVMLFATVMALRVKIDFVRTKKLKIDLNNVIAKEALLPASIVFLIQTTFCVINSFLVVFAGKQGVTKNIGLYFTVTALTMLVTRPMVGKLTDKLGLAKVVAPALLCNVAAFVIISYSNTLIMFLVASFISAFGFGACQPALQALTMKSVPSTRRGAASSTYYIGSDMGNLVGPAISGYVVILVGYANMWRIMVIPLILGIIMIIAFRSKIVTIEKNFVGKVDRKGMAAEKKHLASSEKVSEEGIMTKKQFLIAGQRRSVKSDPMGVTTYRYDPENGDLEFIETICTESVSGQLYVDTQRKVVYVVDEIGNIKGDLGGGGYVRAFRIDRDSGRLTLISEKRSLCPYPSYITLDTTGKYLLVSHCADHLHVTKIGRLEDGSFTSDTVYDDTALVMFRVNDDGSLGDIIDISITPGSGTAGSNSKSFIHPVNGHVMNIQIMSSQHSVTRSPEGRIFAVGDKGMDKIYLYKIDPENGKLIQIYNYSDDVGSGPRYGAFHPTKQYFYVNYEYIPYIGGFTYDPDTGELKKICHVKVVSEDTDTGEGCKDLLMHPNGRYIYSTRNPNTISVMEIAEDGTLSLKQNVNSGGESPRSICLSPDARFLFSGNTRSGNITSFSVAEDGILIPTGKVYDGNWPSVLKIFSLD